jgi:hypothetical protein
MKPIDRAKEWCDEHDECFVNELELHLEVGWVYSGEDAFLMATEEASADLLTLGLNKDVDIDTWYVYLYAGNLKRVLELMPKKQNKYIAFRRDYGAIKIYDTKWLLAKIKGLNYGR